MTSLSLKLTLAGLLSLGVGSTAVAQAWYPGYTSAQPEYGSPSQVSPQDQSSYDVQQQRYQNQRGAYDARTQAWRYRRDAYDDQRDAYSHDRAAYEEQRAEYDAQYGDGAWERRYGH